MTQPTTTPPDPPVAGPVSRASRRRLLLVLLVFFAVFIADQVTKELVVRHIDGPQHRGKNTTFFYLTHDRNPGLVIGLFRTMPLVARSAPIAATIVLVLLYWRLGPVSRLQTIAFGMVAGGAVGNIYDRLFRGGTVVDFLQFNFYFLAGWIPFHSTRYPAFNVADTFICIGVALLLLTWSLLPPGNVSAE